MADLIDTAADLPDAKREDPDADRHNREEVTGLCRKVLNDR
jgi:hypothetical protein